MSLLKFGFKAVKAADSSASATGNASDSILGKRSSPSPSAPSTFLVAVDSSPSVKRRRSDADDAVDSRVHFVAPLSASATVTPAQDAALLKYGAGGIHHSWKPVVAAEMSKPYFAKLMAFVTAARAKSTVFPPEGQTYTALCLTPLESIKVVILGQDPYIQRGQAHGLSFSVPKGQAIPPSLRNMLAEIASDTGASGSSSSSSSSSSSGAGAGASAGKGGSKGGAAKHGCLEAWARQGVLLLNAVLTVEAGKSNSHAGAGWEDFTSALIKAVSDRRTGVVFMLWGRPAQLKGSSVDRKKHLVLEAPHPSPLSAHRGFLGCKHFSKANEYLRARGVAPIDWDVDAVVQPPPTPAAAAKPADAAPAVAAAARSSSAAAVPAATAPAVGGAGAAPLAMAASEAADGPGLSAAVAAEAAHVADEVIAAAAAADDADGASARSGGAEL